MPASDKDRWLEMPVAKLASSEAPQPQVPAARAHAGRDRVKKMELNSSTESAKRCSLRKFMQSHNPASLRGLHLCLPRSSNCITLRALARPPIYARPARLCRRTHHLDRRRASSARYHQSRRQDFSVNRGMAAIRGVSKAWPPAACWLVVLVVVGLVSSSEAYVFYAGGRDGWVVDPTESYNHWAERNRFQVNDIIVFAYDEAADSVLLVTEPDFDACNTRNPVRRLEAAGAGGSAFRFDRSGPFFFISGDEGRCQKGQKLYVIVMAPRPTTPAAGVAPAPGYSQGTAFPPAVVSTAPPPFWASAPEYAQAPGIGGEVTSRSSSMGAPPPTAAAARLEEAGVGAVFGALGALALSAL